MSLKLSPYVVLYDKRVLPSVPESNGLVFEPPHSFSVAVSGVLGDGSRVHTHDHDGYEAPDESPESILSINRPAAGPYRLTVKYETYYPEHPLVKHTSPVYHAHGAQQALCMVGACLDTRRRSPVEGGDSETGGDGDGVVTARSLSTSASGGRDMEGDREWCESTGGNSGSSAGKSWLFLMVSRYSRPVELAVSVDSRALISPSSSAPHKALPGLRVGVGREPV
ncbi:hypothetical protein Tco_0860970 [Tanacetum coccineum]|uniref:Uncharacterized protein n=1 Tax=Tanacetum coccineum TaxID=301880 RepID=A0ABQ5BHB1_9ASTR